MNIKVLNSYESINEELNDLFRKTTDDFKQLFTNIRSTHTSHDGIDEALLNYKKYMGLLREALETNNVVVLSYQDDEVLFLELDYLYDDKEYIPISASEDEENVYIEIVEFYSHITVD